MHSAAVTAVVPPHRPATQGGTVLDLSTDTYQRPDDLSDTSDPRVLYARSYLLVRTAVGVVGMALPTLLFLSDWFFLKGSPAVRDSLSAYYHTGAGDLFVGGLCVVGCLLITYMATQKRSWDYVLSTVAGLAVLGVALLPTWLPDHGQRVLCGDGTGEPLACTPLQRSLGEQLVATVHFASAGVFILSLAALCFIFAARDGRHGKLADERLHRGCGVAILGAVLLFLVGEAAGIELLGLTPLYVAEVASVYAFGLSWFVKGRDLWKTIGSRTPAGAAAA